MKKLLLVIGVICIFSTATYAAGPIGFGAQITAANLNIDGPLKETYGFGWGGGVHVDFSLPLLFAFRLQGDYVTFGLNDAKYKELLAKNYGGTAAQYTADGGRINILSVNASTKYSPLPIPIVSPYLTGGIGIASVSSSDLKVTQAANAAVTFPGASAETNFSANFGVGADLNLIVVKLYLEARYTWIFAKGATSTYVPISLGVTL